MNEELIRKLLIKDEQRVVILNCPESLVSEFEGLNSITKASSEIGDCVIGFVHGEKELIKRLPVAKSMLSTGGKLWIAYPKKSGSLNSDLNRDRIWELVNQQGLNPNRLISMNDDWSVMSLVPRESQQKNSSFGQDPPGVDRKTKTVIPPEDLTEALATNPEAEAFFKSLAFSHQREYVGWIHDAKKAETRARRINKTIDLLLEGKKTK